MKVTKWQVLGVVAILLAVIVTVAVRSGHSHEKILNAALRNGMERVYDKLQAESRTNGAEISPTTMLRVLLNQKGNINHLPSFLAASNVYLPTKPVSMGSRDLLLIVTFQQEDFAIDGLRKWTNIDHNIKREGFTPIIEAVDRVTH